jgi:hypothetical protein
MVQPAALRLVQASALALGFVNECGAVFSPSAIALASPES